MHSIGLRLEVLVAELADRDHYSDFVPAVSDEEPPLAILDALDGLLLAKLPVRPVGVSTTDADDPLVRVEAVTLVDPKHFVAGRHNFLFMEDHRFDADCHSDIASWVPIAPVRYLHRMFRACYTCPTLSES